jgi:recombination protein RecT
MWRKAVFRRLSKWLPKSSDLDDLLRRDDENYDLSGDKAELAAARRRRRSACSGRSRTRWRTRRRSLPRSPMATTALVDPETGEVEEIRQEPGRGPLVEAPAERPEDTGGGVTRASGAPTQASTRPRPI